MTNKKTDDSMLDELLPTADELKDENSVEDIRQEKDDGQDNATELHAEEQTSAQKMMDALTDDDDEKVNLSFGSVLGGDILTAAWIKHQVIFIIVIVLMIIAYITNRYMSQQSMIKINSLKKELAEIRYESMTRSSQLLQRTRESKVIEYLKTTRDSMLNISAQPPYVIKINEEPE